MICFFESVKTPTVGPMLAYLIFVTGTKGGACVKKNARCKFLQIYSVIYEKLTIYCVIYAFFGVNFILQKFCMCKKMTNMRYAYFGNYNS